MLLIQLLFWLSGLALLHTWLVFPLSLRLMVGRKKLPISPWRLDSPSLPKVSVVMAAYNEEKAITTTLTSIFASHYPSDKLEVLVGSDNSTDETNAIVHRMRLLHPNLNLFIYKKRRGKPGILNSMVGKKASGDIVVLCDATVEFHPEAVFNLVRHFHHPEVGIVGGALQSQKLQGGGVANVERAHFSREAQIKHDEGILFGTSMGTFGALYAIRRELFTPIPARFTVDDFFLTLNIMRKGYRSLLDPEAVGFEEVSDLQSEEFRRKVRISMGNWQNLRHFRGLLLSRKIAVSYCFWSHKVLRWMGPGLLLVLLASSLILSFTADFYFAALLLQLVCITLAIADSELRKLNVHLRPFRALNHFYAMNIALAVGFWRWLRGVRTNVWQPTRGLGKALVE